VAVQVGGRQGSMTYGDRELRRQWLVQRPVRLKNGTGSSDIKEQSQEKKGRKVRVVWLKYPVKCCNLITVDDYCRFKV
jgi:hypothetical protein